MRRRKAEPEHLETRVWGGSGLGRASNSRKEQNSDGSTEPLLRLPSNRDANPTPTVHRTDAPDGFFSPRPTRALSMAPPWRGAVPHCERLRLGIGGRDATAGRARNVPDEGAAATDPDPSSAQHAKPKASMPSLVASVPLARGSNPWTRALRCDFARLEGKSGIPAARGCFLRDPFLPALPPATLG